MPESVQTSYFGQHILPGVILLAIQGVASAFWAGAKGWPAQDWLLVVGFLGLEAVALLGLDAADTRRRAMRSNLTAFTGTPPIGRNVATSVPADLDQWMRTYSEAFVFKIESLRWVCHVDGRFYTNPKCVRPAWRWMRTEFATARQPRPAAPATSAASAARPSPEPGGLSGHPNVDSNLRALTDDLDEMVKLQAWLRDNWDGTGEPRAFGLSAELAQIGKWRRRGWTLNPLTRQLDPPPVRRASHSTSIADGLATPAKIQEWLRENWDGTGEPRTGLALGVELDKWRSRGWTLNRSTRQIDPPAR